MLQVCVGGVVHLVILQKGTVNVDKFDIFDHLMDTWLYAAMESGFEYGNDCNKYIITRYDSPSFNCIYWAEDNDIIDTFIERGIPFVCSAQRGFEDILSEKAHQYNFEIATYSVATKFEIPDDWMYQPSDIISIKKVQIDDELVLFDDIAAKCFDDEVGCSYGFWQKAYTKDVCKLYLAYSHNVAVGTILLSYVNNIAGIYWLSVLPEYRNQGIATELINYLIQEAKKDGYNSVIAHNDVPSSLSLFNKIGFQPQGSIPIFEPK